MDAARQSLREAAYLSPPDVPVRETHRVSVVVCLQQAVPSTNYTKKPASRLNWQALLGMHT